MFQGSHYEHYCMLTAIASRMTNTAVHLPANHILHASVFHSNGQVSPFVETPKGSVGRIASRSIGTSLWGMGGPPGWATPMGLD